ncbi:MAG TPA: penicillin acylase family protein [Candidatus Dormibacteraeota bacterium]|nr:penicillin acylase family protein [Candidatus Dormibacteraeota bacterium]
MVALIVVVVVLAVLLALWWVLYRRPLPLVSGSVTVPGVEAPVTIRRDRRGVPHVEARSMEDAAFAMGWVHAQDRGWQMDFNRRVAAGRVSEFAGQEGLPADRFMRRLGLARVAEEEVALLSEEARRMLDAYARGVNAVWESGRPLPLEMTLLRLRPEPWKPAHSLLLGKLLNLGLALNMDNELRRFELLRRLGPEKAAQLDFLYVDTNPTILGSAARAAAGSSGEALELFREAAQWIPAGTGGAASNNWVVDGTLTASGRPILCNDPHLPPSAPSIWYQAHIAAGDDFETTGVTLAGLPFPIIGHNRRVAWGYTNSFADVQDLVIEELSGRDGRQYRTEKGMVDAELRSERITVKGLPDPVVEDVVVTRHGPLVDRYEDKAAGMWRGLALQWTALKPGGAAETVLQLQRASDWRSFKQAFAPLDGPSQNVVYADVDGHIGYLLSGHVPVRARAASGLPVPGWTGDALWKGVLGIDEVPQVLDPPEHLVVTANNRVVGPEFPHHIGMDYMNGYRALRIREILTGRSGLTMSDMAAAQLDITCPPAREVAQLLGEVRCEQPLAEEARANLARWDGVLDPESAEACVYEAFMRRLTQHALEPLCGEHWPLAAGELPHPVFGMAGNLVGGVTPHLLRRWREGDTSWFAPGVTWQDVAARALEDAVADLRRRAGRPRRWRWGRLHAVPVDHVLGRKRPLNLLFNAGSIEIGGDTDTVLQTAYVSNDPYRARGWAPSWRQILDVGDWDACTGIHFPGQSGHPGSRNYRDMIADWTRNAQQPLAWSREAVAAATHATLVLTPAPVAQVAPSEHVAEEAA